MIHLNIIQREIAIRVSKKVILNERIIYSVCVTCVLCIFFWGGVTKLEYIHISNSLLLLCHLIPNLLFFYRFEIMHSVYDCTSNNFKIIQRKKMQ